TLSLAPNPAVSMSVHIPCKIFFCSSRRRHTRSKRDWSSDVCSSDLATNQFFPFIPLLVVILVNFTTTFFIFPALDWSGLEAERRSEERRVGKECRTRASRCRYKQKRVGGARGCGWGGRRARGLRVES